MATSDTFNKNDTHLKKKNIKKKRHKQKKKKKKRHLKKMAPHKNGTWQILQLK